MLFLVEPGGIDNVQKMVPNSSLVVCAVPMFLVSMLGYEFEQRIQWELGGINCNRRARGPIHILRLWGWLWIIGASSL